MDEAGIDKALVFAGELNDCPNDWMLEQIAPHKDRLMGVAAASPKLFAFQGSCPVYVNEDLRSSLKQKALFHEREDIKKLTDWYGEGKIVACKFYTGYEHYEPSNARLHLEALNKLKCPAIFHMGDCLNSVKKAKLKFANPMLIDDVAVDFPNMNFIIAHAGNPWVSDAAEVCYKNDNVYADISGFVYKDFSDKDELYFSKMMKEFLEISSVDKLLFGTDFPISNQKSYIQTIDNIKAFTAEHLTKNIIKAFKLP